MTADTTVIAKIVTPANPTITMTPSYNVTDHRVGKRIACPAVKQIPCRAKEIVNVESAWHTRRAGTGVRRDLDGYERQCPGRAWGPGNATTPHSRFSRKAAVRSAT